MKPRIGVLTTFGDFSPSYSLCSVVESQLYALVRHGYAPVLFVLPSFNDDTKVPKGVEIRKIVPQFLLIDYGSNQPTDPNLDAQADQAFTALLEHTKDIDFIIQHDLIFQGWFLPYAIAIHRLAKANPKIKWLHWVHSNMSGRPINLSYPHLYRYELPQNSKLVYLNNHYIIRAAETYGLFPKDVRIVYNSVDPRLTQPLEPIVNTICDQTRFLEADLTQVYPVSSTRMVDGKQLPIVIEIFSKLKQLGKTVCLIVANAHANDKREKQVIAQMQSLAAQQGLSAAEVVFTSLLDTPKYELGISRIAVSQLSQLTNLFIFPSKSENCPLILLEAMLNKNLLILNDNVPTMREFAQGNALYFKFSSNDDTVTYQNRDSFMLDIAKIINSEYERNPALKASTHVRKNFNADTIFTSMIEPLFYGQ